MPDYAEGDQDDILNGTEQTKYFILYSDKRKRSSRLLSTRHKQCIGIGKETTNNGAVLFILDQWKGLRTAPLMWLGLPF